MSEDNEIQKLREDYKRALDGLQKIEHIIEAFLAISSPQSKPYAEVLQRIVKESRGEDA